MENQNREVISYNKVKLTGLILFSLLLIWQGADNIFYNAEMRPYYLKYIASAFLILFFGFSCYIWIKKLFFGNPAIVIEKSGITDNSTTFSAVYIPWDEIKDIKANRLWSGNFVSISLKNPQIFISLQKNRKTRRLLQANYNRTEYPITISTGLLNISSIKLVELLKNNLSRYTPTV